MRAPAIPAAVAARYAADITPATVAVSPLFGVLYLEPALGECAYGDGGGTGYVGGLCPSCLRDEWYAREHELTLEIEALEREAAAVTAAITGAPYAYEAYDDAAPAVRRGARAALSAGGDYGAPGRVKRLAAV